MSACVSSKLVAAATVSEDNPSFLPVGFLQVFLPRQDLSKTIRNMLYYGCYILSYLCLLLLHLAVGITLSHGEISCSHVTMMHRS